MMVKAGFMLTGSLLVSYRSGRCGCCCIMSEYDSDPKKSDSRRDLRPVSLPVECLKARRFYRRAISTPLGTSKTRCAISLKGRGSMKRRCRVAGSIYKNTWTTKTWFSPSSDSGRNRTLVCRSGACSSEMNRHSE